MRAMEESDEDDDDDDEAMMFQGNDTWADRDEEYIARVQVRQPSVWSRSRTP